MTGLMPYMSYPYQYIWMQCVRAPGLAVLYEVYPLHEGLGNELPVLDGRFPFRSFEIGRAHV